MAGRELVLNDVLCFILTKFRKYSTSLLKRVIIEFFADSAILEAKNQLVDDISLLDIAESLPKVTRFDSDSVRYTEDIFNLLSFVDERCLFDRLPRYVTDDCDRIPATSLSEGDLKLFFDILNKTSTKIDVLSGTVSLLATDICSLKDVYIHPQSSLSQPQSSWPKQSVVINKAIQLASNSTCSDVTVRQPPGLPGQQYQSNKTIHSGISTTSTITTGKVRDVEPHQTFQPGVRWSSSTPVRNRFDILGSITDDDIAQSDNADDGPFTTVVSRREQKEARRHPKRPLVSSPEEEQISMDQLGYTQQQPSARRSRPLLVGSATASNLAAAKKLLKKSVFLR